RIYFWWEEKVNRRFTQMNADLRLSAFIRGLKKSAFFDAQVGFEQRGGEGGGGDIKRESTNRFNHSQCRLSMVNNLLRDGLRKHILHRRRYLSHHCFQIPISNRHHKRQVTRPQDV